jgi:hypothetical protein
MPSRARSLQNLGDIMISSRTAIPASLPTPYQQIEIPVGLIAPANTLSPPAVRNLVRAGYDAAANFFANEDGEVAKSGYVSRRLDMGSQSTLVDQTMVQLKSARRNIFIAGGDLSWAWDAFPVLALKALAGLSIRILSGKSVDPVLATTLGRLGCEVREATIDLLTYGTFIDPAEPDGTAVLVKLQDGRLSGGALVDNQSGSGVLAALMERFHLLWSKGVPQSTAERPELEPVEWRVVEAALRAHIAQYRDAVLSLRPIEVGDLLPLSHSLGVARLRRAQAVADLYRRSGGTLFDPMRVRDSFWFLAPPVVEAVDGRLALIDGAHRIYHCRNHALATVSAIVVHHAGDPPPAEICRSWDEVVPLPDPVGREERYAHYEPSRWRDIRSAWTAIAHQSLPARPSAQACRYPSTFPQS